MPAAQAQEGGPYAVIVSNPHGYTIGNTSVSFPPPSISAQPQDLRAYRGETAALTVTTLGLAPFTYRWFKDSSEIPGATNSTYLIAGVDLADAAMFKVTVTDVAGASVTSDPAKLTVIDPPSNFGWMLISDNESLSGTARHFGSSKSGAPPTLVLGYAIPAPPPEIAGLRIESTNFVFQIPGKPGWIYRIQTREKVETGDWIDLTNAPAGAALEPIIVRVPLTTAHQFFRVIQN